MQYYVSRPMGWTINSKWPVIIVVESANKQFKETLEIFAKARKDAPFILAAPLVTTNGGANYRQADTYHYSEATWQEIEKDRCKFDLMGLPPLPPTFKKHAWRGAPFLTAGGRWPTRSGLCPRARVDMAAAAPAVSNYAGRCLAAGFSSAPSRIDLPVTVFQVEGGRDVMLGKFVHRQSQQAMKVATAQGFRNVTERVVANRPHGPLADEVVAYCWSLWKGRRP
jgi:hypothetical protein